MVVRKSAIISQIWSLFEKRVKFATARQPLVVAEVLYAERSHGVGRTQAFLRRPTPQCGGQIPGGEGVASSDGV